MGPALKSSAFVMRYEVFFFLEKIVASDWRRNEIVQIVLELAERTHEFLPWKGMPVVTALWPTVWVRDDDNCPYCFYGRS